jgi:hypothetical protein
MIKAVICQRGSASSIDMKALQAKPEGRTENSHVIHVKVASFGELCCQAVPGESGGQKKRKEIYFRPQNFNQAQQGTPFLGMASFEHLKFENQEETPTSGCPNSCRTGQNRQKHTKSALFTTS